MRAQTVSLVLLALLVGANATGVMSINKAVSLPSVNVNVSGSHSGFQFTKSIGHATPETVAAPAPVQVQAVQKPETKPAPQPERKPETKPAPQPAIQAVQKPEAKPAPQPAIQAVQKPETKPAPQPAIQAVQKPETKTAPQPEKKVEVQAEKKVEVKAEKVVEVKAEKPAFQKQIEALVATKQAEIDAHKAAPSVQEAAAPKIVSINLGHGKGVAATAPESRVQPREADSTGKGISFSIQKTLPEIDMSHGKGITLGRRLAHFGSVSINKDNAMPLVSKNISIGHSGKGIQITKSIAGAASAMEAPATPVLVEAVSKPQPKAEAKVEKKVEVQAAPVVQKSVSAQAAAPVMTKSIDMQAVHPFSKILSHLGKDVAPASEARVQPRQADSTGKGISVSIQKTLPEIDMSHGKGITLGRRLAHFGSVSINKDNAMPLVSKNISIGHSGKGIQITKSIAGAASAMEAPATPILVEAVSKPQPKAEAKVEKKVEVQAAPVVQKSVSAQAAAPVMTKSIDMQAVHPFSKILSHLGKGVAPASEARVQPRQADSTGKGISISIQKTLPEIDMSHGKGITLGRRLAHFGSVSINKDNAMPLVSKNISIGHSGKGIQITKSIAGAASAMEAPATPVLVEAVSKPQPKAEAKVEKKVEVQAAPVVQKSVSAQAAAPVMTKSIDMQAVHPFSKILSHLGKGVAPASEARVQPRQESTGKGFSFQKTVSLPQISFSHGKGVAATAPEARVQPREADSTGKGISFSMGNGL